MVKSRECRVHRVPMSHPGDVSHIAKLFDNEQLRPEQVVAIFGKTEGNGCVNDFTRAYAVDTLTRFFSERLSVDTAHVSRRIAMVMSGGTEGGIAPHFLVFSVCAVEVPTASYPDGYRLAIGASRSKDFLPEEIGTPIQVRETAAAVLEAMKSAGLTTVEDVHFVQIKCPLLTSDRIADAKTRGQQTVTEETYASMGYSRGASALGVGVALDEISPDDISDGAICEDWSLWSGRASASAGVELMNCEVIVLGNSSEWYGGSQIFHDVMTDPIDSVAVHRVLASAQIRPTVQVDEPEQRRIQAVLVKADPPGRSDSRGNRHIMNDDSDINATRHARALVGGVISAVVGRTDNFVSGGAEHQGPDGGGPVAAIISASE